MSGQDHPTTLLQRIRYGARPRVLLLGLSALIIAVFTSLVAITLWENRQEAMEDSARTRQNLVRTLEEHALGRARETELILNVLGYRLDQQLAEGTLDPSHVRPLLAEYMRSSPPFRNVVVYDALGHRITDANGNTVDFDGNTREYFTTLRDDPDAEFHVSLPYHAVIANEWSIGISHRLHRGDGGFGGIVLAAFDLTKMTEFYGTLDVGSGGNVTLWDGEAARVLARYPANPDLLGRVFPRGELYELIRSGYTQGTFESASPLDGITRMLTFARVPGLPMVLSVAQSHGDVLAEWRQDVWRYGVGASIGVAVLLALTWLLLKQFTRQERLVSALEVSERETRRTNERLSDAMVAVETASRAKSEFLACMSHELRTPLNAVIGFADFIASGITKDMDKVRGYAKDIGASGQHLLKIISDILEVSRIEAGKIELDEELVDLASVIAASLRLVEHRARERQIALSSKLADGVPLLRADQTKLTQALLNLLTNAIKFTPAGGSIELDTRVEPDGNVALAVSDTGIGMTAEEIEIAVQPFRQVQSHLARNYDGVGLGLSLAKSFVELHGGRLLLTSVPGKGTTARIILPRDRVVVPLVSAAD